MDILDSNTHQNLIPTRIGRGGRLESAPYARSRGLKDIALCSIMWNAMLRRSEAAGLAWSDVRRAASRCSGTRVRSSFSALP